MNIKDIARFFVCGLIKQMNRDLGIDFFNSKDQESKEEFSWK